VETQLAGAIPQQQTSLFFPGGHFGCHVEEAAAKKNQKKGGSHKTSKLCTGVCGFFA